jgi:dTDP-4-dehydrorhamnose reductase
MSSTAVRLLVLGSTGTLGQAMLAQARAREWSCCGAARSDAESSVDVTDLAALEALLDEVRPSVVVNCAAITNLADCEERPAFAYAVNARVPGWLAELSLDRGIDFVQVSSDHFFTGDGAATHDEKARVRLVNEYARTKYAGEVFALTAPTTLAVRTNLVGLRRWPGRPNFAEWALDAVENDRPLPLFEDFFTSSMHSRACSTAILDLIQMRARGLVNIASSQVVSKRAFVQALARALGVELSRVSTASVRGLTPRRAESLGLDVRRAESLLGRRLPDLHDTVRAVVEEHQGI